MTDSTTAPSTRDPVRTRTVVWQDPMIGAAAAMSMSGLEYLRAIATRELPTPPVALLLGMDVVSVDPGRAVFTLEPGEHLYNPIGSVHGGMLATVLDSALGCAVQSMLPAGVGYTTVDLNVTYLRAATRDTGRLTCEGEVIHSGRKIATSRGQIVDEKGRRYATATTTCLIIGGKKDSK